MLHRCAPRVPRHNRKLIRARSTIADELVFIVEDDEGAAVLTQSVISWVTIGLLIWKAEAGAVVLRAYRDFIEATAR
jgi:hypothetical protein